MMCITLLTLLIAQASAAGNRATSCSIALSGSNDGSATDLQACTGECDDDSQCASGLTCFQRDNGETIPGCTGSGNGLDWDYCYDPICEGLPCFKPLSGTNDGAATALESCTGECDDDSQCASGLTCFQRDNGGAIPGCTGNGGGDGWDYCYHEFCKDPCAVPLSGSNDGSATDLQACTGECDDDSQCASGLTCFQRDNGETIPGCTGSGNGLDWDYCYDPVCVTDPCAVPLSGSNDGSATDLQACIGECDDDSQCASGLACFQRDNGEAIPGCTGSGDGNAWDYCYDPVCEASDDSSDDSSNALLVQNADRRLFRGN